MEDLCIKQTSQYYITSHICLQAAADPRGKRGRLPEGEESVLRADVPTDRQHVRTDGRQRLATSYPGGRQRAAEHPHHKRLGQIRKLHLVF